MRHSKETARGGAANVLLSFLGHFEFHVCHCKSSTTGCVLVSCSAHVISPFFSFNIIIKLVSTQHHPQPQTTAC